MKLNPEWTQSMLSTPNPEATLGLYFIKPFIDYHYGLGYKEWKKIIQNGKLKYKFHAIWHRNW